MHQADIIVPILCRFWLEDEIWNGVAVDLPVAVFGESFEAALSNLKSALKCHMEVVFESGKAAEIINHLQEKRREYGFLSMDEISEDSPIVKMLVAMKKPELLAVTS